jgi:hypothetical protein
MIRCQNSNDITHIQSWLDELQTFNIPENRSPLNIDYAIYGEGEQQLAWFDKSVVIESGFGDAHFIARKIIQTIFKQIADEKLFIGHLKFFLRTKTWSDKISFTSLSTSANFKIRNEETNSIEILINARVQTEPKTLSRIMDNSLKEISSNHTFTITHGHESVFKPGLPKPTYHIP